MIKKRVPSLLAAICGKYPPAPQGTVFPQLPIVTPSHAAAPLNAFHSAIVFVGINLSLSAGEALLVIFLQLLSWRVIFVTEDGATRHPSRAELIA